MVKVLILFFISLSATEISFAAICQGKWHYREFKSCEHRDNGVRKPMITEEGSETTYFSYSNRTETYHTTEAEMEQKNDGRFINSLYNKDCKRIILTNPSKFIIFKTPKGYENHIEQIIPTRYA